MWFDAFSRGRYSTDASAYQIEPIGVVVPRTAEDVVSAIQIAADEEVVQVIAGVSALRERLLFPKGKEKEREGEREGERDAGGEQREEVGVDPREVEGFGVYADAGDRQRERKDGEAVQLVRQARAVGENRALLDDAGRRLADVSDPVDDVRASGAYRRRVIPRLVRRAVAEARTMGAGA